MAGAYTLDVPVPNRIHEHVFADRTGVGSHCTYGRDWKVYDLVCECGLSRQRMTKPKERES